MRATSRSTPARRQGGASPVAPTVTSPSKVSMRLSALAGSPGRGAIDAGTMPVSDVVDAPVVAAERTLEAGGERRHGDRPGYQPKRDPGDERHAQRHGRCRSLREPPAPPPHGRHVSQRLRAVEPRRPAPPGPSGGAI
ncbi:MAG TPA: hypothetical protein VNO26_06410 [Candidatus Limnocylindria bacterium]|nr:hypothetical protein [Candidatus Limnocylindria bacterium]